jgi:Smg protein
MKDNLFEILLNLFETSLTQIQKEQISTEDIDTTDLIDAEVLSQENQSLFIKSQDSASTRVFTYEEQMKLTKASYQFLIRMKLWKVLDENNFEHILNQLQFSDSRIVTLQETKWTIRNALADHLTENQLSFLDLVLYQSEDKIEIH